MRTQAICFAFAIVLLCPIASGQWVQTNGPYGGTITCFAMSGTSLFAGTPDGVYLSTNQGESWASVDNGLPDTRINVLLVFGTHLFAGTGDGLFLSSDNGTSWTASNTGLPPDTAVLSLTVSGTNLFAGTDGHGVFLSTNNGTTWSYASGGVPYDGCYTSVRELSTVGTTIFAVMASWGVFRSTNMGASWSEVATQYFGTPTKLGVKDGHLFVASNTGVFRSADNGSTWTQVSDPGSVQTFAVSNSNLFAGTDGGGVYLSNDDGTSWISVKSGLGNLHINAVVANASTLFAGSNGGGVFRSSDNGTNWSPASFGLPKLSVNALAVSVDETTNQNLVAAASVDGGVFVSSDDGANWSPACRGLANPAVNALAGMGTNLFAGSYPMESYRDNMLRLMGGGIVRSTTAGISWDSVNSSLLGYSRYVNTILVTGETLFIGTYDGGVFQSTNGGTTWVPVGHSGPYYSVPGNVSSLVLDTIGSSPGSTLFAGVGRDKWYHTPGVYRFTDGDSVWTLVGLNDVAVGAMALLPNGASGANIYASTFRYDGGPGGLVEGKGTFLSTDNGTSWDSVNNGLTNRDIRALITSGTNLFAGTGGGVFLTTDYGRSWVDISSGMPSFAVLTFAVSTKDLFAGTESGIWRRPLSEMISTSVNSPSEELPSTFILGQNYPNPFNPTTTIRYALPHQSHVTLTIFNTLGQNVAELVNGDIGAGHHSVEFNAAHLASGVYFYRMQAGEDIQAKSFVVLR